MFDAISVIDLHNTTPRTLLLGETVEGFTMHSFLASDGRFIIHLYDENGTKEIFSMLKVVPDFIAPSKTSYPATIDEEFCGLMVALDCIPPFDEFVEMTPAVKDADGNLFYGLVEAFNEDFYLQLSAAQYARDYDEVDCGFCSDYDECSCWS